MDVGTSPSWHPMIPASPCACRNFPNSSRRRRMTKTRLSLAIEPVPAHTHTYRTMNLSAFRPVFRACPAPWIPRARPSHWHNNNNNNSSIRSVEKMAPSNRIRTAPFSSTAQMQKRAKKGPGNDPRISRLFSSSPHTFLLALSLKCVHATKHATGKSM